MGRQYGAGMTHRLGILKRSTGRRIVAWATTAGLLVAMLLMPQAMVLAMPMAAHAAPHSAASASQTDDHAGHAGVHAHQHQHAQDQHAGAPLPDPDSSGCGLCNDCALCAMTLPMMIGSIASPDYPPARLRIAETNLLPGILPPPPAEPPRV